MAFENLPSSDMAVCSIFPHVFLQEALLLPLYVSWCHLKQLMVIFLMQKATIAIKNKLHEDMIDHRSYTHNLSSYKIKAWQKFKPEMEFKPMTSAISVQCSTNWTIKPTENWPVCECLKRNKEVSRRHTAQWDNYTNSSTASRTVLYPLRCIHCTLP